MKQHLLTLTAVLAACAGLGLGAAGLASADPAVAPGAEPHPKTIVEVLGDKADGFEIRRLDGTELFPPTDSEAFAECGEYDTRVAVVRCRTEVRVWYRELAQLQRSLAYVRSQAG